MNLQEIIDLLNLNLLTTPKDFTQVYPSSGYASDLLSCVMANAQHQGIWITLQAHINIVAVAALLELSAVIISENALPDVATISRANNEGVTLLATSKSTFSTVGLLWDLGLRESGVTKA
jgi:hypothetical protein